MKYVFTLTLRPRMYTKCAKDQFDFCYPILMGIFRNKHWANVPISCITELTKENNVHYHGVIELDDLTQRDKFINEFRKHNSVFGKKEVVQLQFEESWYKYILGDMDNTKVIIPFPMVIDRFHLLSEVRLFSSM